MKQLHLVRLSLLCTLSCGPDSSFAPTTVVVTEDPNASTADLKRSDVPTENKIKTDDPGATAPSTSSEAESQPSLLVELTPVNLPSLVPPILPVPPTLPVTPSLPEPPTVPVSPVTQPLPVVPPSPSKITPPKCASNIPIIAANQSVDLKWSGDGPFTFAIVRGTQTSDLGTIDDIDLGTVRYLAPSRIATSEDISVAATNATGEKASCLVRLKADGALGVADDGRTPGLVGTVYQVPLADRNNSARIRSTWFTGTPLSSIVMPRIDVPNTPYEQGFPGQPNLTSWFAIRFRAQILIPEDGYYGFQTQSDDGSLLYIDGRTIVRNDTVHAITTVTNDQVYLAAGLHDIQLDYFQGPPIYIAMSLLWRKPTDSRYSLIPASQFSRPKN